MALSQINDPRYHGEVNFFRGLSDLQDTLERMMKDTQRWVMEVMKEIVTVQTQLDLCKKRLEISDMYEELDCHIHPANPVPTHPHQSPVQSPLVEAPRVVRAIVPLPSQARGLADIPLLHDTDLDNQCVSKCYRCKAVGHVVSQCPKKRRNKRCAACGSTHKLAKCPTMANTKAVTPKASEDADGKRMTLLECIALLDRIEYSPAHCTKCGCQNPEHLEMECPMYEQYIGCYQWGPKDFVRRHSCSTISEVSWGAKTDYYEEEWYQGCD